MVHIGTSEIAGIGEGSRERKV